MMDSIIKRGLLVLVCGFVLAGCGGGGGGGSSSLDVGDAAAKAANNLPKQGSVTQSSNGMADNQGGTLVTVTQDTVGVTDITFNSAGTYDFKITANVSGNKVTIEQSVFDYSEVDSSDITRYLGIINHAGNYSGILNDDDGMYIADFYTGVSLAADNTVTDWLAGGTWIYLPEDGTANIGIGAFADAKKLFPKNDIASLSGSATYEGGFFPVYTVQNGAESYYGWANARVLLEVTFGSGGDNNLGTIHGIIDSIEDRENSIDGVYYRPLPVTGTITLNSASITNTDDGGFFTGDITTGSIQFVDRNRNPVTISNFAGKWGGEFTSDGGDSDSHPDAVFGTAGATGSAAGYGTLSVIGAYFGVK